jgi:hypothetical protein
MAANRQCDCGRRRNVARPSTVGHITAATGAPQRPDATADGSGACTPALQKRSQEVGPAARCNPFPYYSGSEAGRPDTSPSAYPPCHSASWEKIDSRGRTRAPDHAAWTCGKFNRHLHKRAVCAPSHNCPVGPLSNLQEIGLPATQGWLDVCGFRLKARHAARPR